jgi:cytochrome c peroxidase
MLGASDELNPCAAKTLNPCAAKTLNPCAAKTLNPCGAVATVDPARIKQPVGVKLASGSQSNLVSTGEQLWNDRMLGKSGLACASCHVDSYGQMLPSFGEPYPHEVASSPWRPSL